MHDTDNTVHFSLVAALHKWASQPTTARLPVATVLDSIGRPATTLTYGRIDHTIVYLYFAAKLYSRSTKLAHFLLHKSHTGKDGKEKGVMLKSGDRVALVYPNTDPINFQIAFYACLMAGLLPVPIEVPLSKRVRILGTLNMSELC
jgi:acyl-CoA synthetase (AMP-forming)/AMP-acid ligase II